MNIQLGVLRKLIHELMYDTPSKKNPIMVWPKVGPSGKLMWIVKDQLRTAVINTETGEVHGNMSPGNNESFDVIVGALREWYVVDKKEYNGENIVKVKDEISLT